MRLTAVLLMLSTLTVFAKGNAQTVTINEVNVPLKKVINLIQQQTGYYISYNEAILGTPFVTVRVVAKGIKETLDQCLKGLPITYYIGDKYVALNKKADVEHAKEFATAVPIAILISGIVTNEKGEPIAGVDVSIKNSKVGVVTDSKGNYQIRAEANSILIFGFIGYQQQEIAIGGSDRISIQMQPNQSELDQVQVIAYGTTTKRLGTGNVTTITAEDIERQPVQNPMLALQGRVPGLVVTQNTGVAGGGVTVRLQGQNSLNTANGNDPLIIVDGIPYPSQTLRTTVGGNPTSVTGSSQGGAGYSGAGSPLNYLNPADIESISVLKDADATAIYGSRAANGAIIITTKSGKGGALKFELDIQKGWGKVGRRLDLMNTAQYLEMRREAFQNDGLPLPSITQTPSNTDFDVNGLWDTTLNTNWQDVLIGGTMESTNRTVRLSGGEGDTRFLAGVNYYNQSSVFPGDFGDQRISGNFALNSSSKNQRLKFQLTSSYLSDKNKLPGVNLVSNYIYLAPNAPKLYNGDGSLNWAPRPSGEASWTNPIATLNNVYENTTRNFIANSIINYQIFPSLLFKANGGYNILDSKEFISRTSEAIDPSSRSTFVRGANSTRSVITSWIFEPQLDFKTNLAHGNLDFLAGFSVQQRISDGENINSTGYINDQLIGDLASASSISVNTSVSKYRYNALFFRMNYSFLRKYILNVTGRRDGSSRFGPENRFHNFGAIGTAWVFSEEQFFKRHSTCLSFGKLRASYGTTGNDQIPDYQYMSLMRSYTTGVAYQGLPGLTLQNLYNPYLEWERTRKFSVGLDLGFLKDRLLLTASYSRNRSDNQLLSYKLPGFVGFTSVIDNFPATVENVSWEYSLSSINIKSNSFQWKTSFNITMPKNRLVSFPAIENSSYSRTLIVGQPTTISLNYLLNGVDPATGLFQFVSSKGELTSSPLNPDDRFLVVNSLPKFYGGIQNTFEYKGMQLDFFLQFTKQDVNFNDEVGRGGAGRFISGTNNQTVSVLSRWRKIGDVSNIQKYSTLISLGNISSSARASNISDASFVRLKNISISYELSNDLIKKFYVKRLRFFVSGQNLFTLTKSKTIDPETQTALPPLRIFNTGLQLTL